MSDVFKRDPELVLLTGLCRELGALRLNVWLGDSRPEVMVWARLARSLCITVDASLRVFQWREGQERHPVTDPAGAAARIAEYVKTSDSGSGEGL